MTELIGLPLETAHALLAEQGVSPDKIVIHQTSPPRVENASGIWRVLRCSLSDKGFYEVVAAREQLSEARSAA